ncbi:MAG: SDR family oxidoreductase [Rhizobiales bacterium]|nr:SDR family oxidoreductase [Hyphomicrobiales bacterium]
MAAFDGLVVIVTGGSAGIGLASALRFAEEGARVLITGRNAEALDTACRQHPSLRALVADGHDPGSPARIVDAALGLGGRIDVLVNNAGTGVVAPLVAATAQSIDEVFSLNVRGPALLAAAAVPHLERTRGSILNVSSTGGTKAGPNISIYSGSKAAIEHMTRCWALELAPLGIRVNAIAPGPVKTGFLRNQMRLPPDTIPAHEERERKAVPLGRRGHVDDIAQWMLDLARPTNTWMTGQVVVVDGGFGIA